jgi:hypothetical protein
MSPVLSNDRKITRNVELWLAAKEAACHFWDPANDGTAAMHDRVTAIGFMIAFLARWQVPEAGPDAFCDDIAAAAKATLADFAKEDATTEAASAPSAEGEELLTNEGSAPSSACQFDLVVDDWG